MDNDSETKKNKYIIDSSSLINFIDNYYFDKQNGAKTYSTLLNFIIDKINTENFIIIDKVYDELKSLRSIDSRLKQVIISHKKSTLPLIPSVSTLIDKYKNPFALRRMGNVEISNELDKYENKYADLFLIAYSNSILDKFMPIIITEETPRPDKKIMLKIPQICSSANENVECINMPNALFEVYANNLIFNLDINK